MIVTGLSRETVLTKKIKRTRGVGWGGGRTTQPQKSSLQLSVVWPELRNNLPIRLPSQSPTVKLADYFRHSIEKKTAQRKIKTKICLNFFGFGVILYIRDTHSTANTFWAFSIRKKDPLSISGNFDWRTEQHFKEIPEKKGHFTRFTQIFENFWPGISVFLNFLTKFLVEWFAFNSFSDFAETFAKTFP